LRSAEVYGVMPAYRAYLLSRC